MSNGTLREIRNSFSGIGVLNLYLSLRLSETVMSMTGRPFGPARGSAILKDAERDGSSFERRKRLSLLGIL
jgi:hypothetical protein